MVRRTAYSRSNTGIRRQRSAVLLNWIRNCLAVLCSQQCPSSALRPLSLYKMSFAGIDALALTMTRSLRRHPQIPDIL